MASGTASSSKADDVFNVSRISAVLGHVRTSDFKKPTPDPPVGMGFNSFGKANGAYELAKPWGAVASGTTSSSKTNGVYNASRTDTVLGRAVSTSGAGGAMLVGLLAVARLMVFVMLVVLTLCLAGP